MSNNTGYWTPSLIYVRPGSPCDGAIYYKSVDFDKDCTLPKPIESGLGGNFDGGGASARYNAAAFATDLLGVVMILAILVHHLRKVK